MLHKKISLLGDLVTMKGMDERDFDKIIAWRNDPEINRYLNQPYNLTYEMQEKWYNEKYSTSDDILLIFVEKASCKKFGTVGAYDFQQKQNRVVTGRLIIGEREFRRSPELLEGMLLFYDFLFYEKNNRKLYCHVVEENKPAMSLNRRFGFVENMGKPAYPHHCEANGMELKELVCDLESYEKKKEGLMPMLQHFISQKINDIEMPE